jgi:DNA-directed RNA polymerase III subunit RPC4
MGEDGQPIAADTSAVAVASTEPVDPKEGRLYLFQFPPILPKLYNPTGPIKKDPTDGEEVQMTDIPVSGHGTPVDLTGPDLKADPDASIVINGAENKEEEDTGPTTTNTQNLLSEPGMVGKLIVRKSGKVELSWGGTSLQLGRGAEFDFLTTGLVVKGLGADSGKTKPRMGVKEEGAGGVTGSGTGMGRIMGKFVAVPDWGKLF